MKSKVLIFPDKIHTRMRLIEAAVAAVFLTFILAIGALNDAGYVAIPVILIPSLLILDGMIRFMALRKDIVVDVENDTLPYPKGYSRKTIALSSIHSENTSKTVHTGAQLGVTTYSYDINLYGDFGVETLIFASKKAWDEVIDSIRESLKKIRSLRSA
jgi:hypothetical protein